MTPLITVVVPTYNRPTLLKAALDSIAEQVDVPGDVEVIVVNDGGADVSDVIDAARTGDTDIRLIDLPTNSGLPVARNTGIDAARGEYLALLDDDDLFLPTHLATMLAAIGYHDVDLAFGRFAIATHRIDLSRPYRVPPTAPVQFAPELLDVANMLAVHTAVMRMPPPGARFDPELPALEDWDMWLQLMRTHHYRFHHVPATTVIYHRIPQAPSMCESSLSAPAGLAAFSKLSHRIHRRWPAPTAQAEQYRHFVDALYLHAITVLLDGGTLRPDFFQRGVAEIAASWHGTRLESDLPDRIIAVLEDPLC